MDQEDRRPLPHGITREERALLLADLDLDAAVEWQRSTPEAVRRELEKAWTPATEIPGRPPALRVKEIRRHPRAFARFIAYEFAPVTDSERRRGRWAGWFVAGYLGKTSDGHAGIVQLAVEPERDGFEVTPTVMRELSPARFRATALAHVRETPQWLMIAQRHGLAGASAAAIASAERAAAEASEATPRRRGRKGRPHDFYREVALEAIELGRGRTRGVLPEIAARRGYSREYVRDWVRRARDLGFLAPARPGRTSFEPGPNLRPPAD